MSEPRDQEPLKDGGLKPSPAPQSSDAGLSKTGGGEKREPRSAENVELGDSPGGREGGMIGEG
jgi:hypothetical protein